MRYRCVSLVGLVTLLMMLARPAAAQQRPLATEDPEPVGAGRILLEAGVDLVHDQQYPVSGLRGNLVRIPTIGISFGISSIAELQIDGDFYSRLNISQRNPFAPLASSVPVGDSSSGVDDAVIATKIRLLSESAGRPAIGIRFATKLPNSSNASGLDLNTTDFFISLLGAKTVQSIRVVGNLGVGILSDPTDGARQNDDLTYGLSFARAVTQEAELVGELNGRVSTRSGTAFPGTETRGLLRLGGRYTVGMLRLDAGLFFGLTSVDPTVGFTTGLTYVFNGFKVP
jgi:outer membrane putative beta-barrel porin/alpha-amylase